MIMENEGKKEAILGIAKEVAKEVYNDVGKPIVRPTGDLIGLIPRAIKAAMLPLEKWTIAREYNLKETYMLLENKLKNVCPENLVTPEPYVAIPTLQYLSYCMDNEELRDMYANLLSSAMNDVVKKGVHPGFVEIIKQLSPDEAKILRYMKSNSTIPTISLRACNTKGDGIYIIKGFSNVGELAQCEEPLEINKYFDNLVRLGLIEKSKALSVLTDKTLYESLKKHEFINSGEEYVKGLDTNHNVPNYEEGYISVTDFGKMFCSICL